MSTIDAGEVDIYDPDWYTSGDVHGTFAELRRTDPVHWQDMPGEPGYWAVLRHADVVHVARGGPPPGTPSSAPPEPAPELRDRRPFLPGRHLARLEAKIFFEELLSTFRTIEPTGEPVRARSNLNNGFKRMPVRVGR